MRLLHTLGDDATLASSSLTRIKFHVRQGGYEELEIVHACQIHDVEHGVWLRVIV